MSRIDHENMKLQYRHYTVDPDLPVLFFVDEARPYNPFYALNYGCEVRYMHMHNCIEIACVEEDGGELCHEDEIRPLKKDDVVVVMPHHAHILRMGEGGPTAHYFYFDPILFISSFQPDIVSIKSLWVGMHCSPCTVFQGETAQKIRSRVDEIIAEIRSRRRDSRLCAKGLLLSLSVELSRSLGQDLSLESRTGGVTAIMPALQYIHSHFQENITSAQLQEMCHLSGTHFRRLFHSAMSCSPLEYIQNLRISNACDQLLSGSLSILDISLRVGYDSISSFNRQFIKIVGMPPSQWRKEKRQEKYNMLPESSYEPQE